MNTLIIDIRETSLRAVLSDNGTLQYCRTFDFEPLPQTNLDSFEEGSSKLKHAPAADNPYLIYYDIEAKSPWDVALKQIVNQIRSDIQGDIDSAHLIVPSDEVMISSHQLPKMPRVDAEKVIGRKISLETKEEFPPFTILPSAADQKTQTWQALYIPTAILRDYKKAFASCQMRLTSITTPVNAMIDAFRSVREAIFNAHAIFEVQRGFIEAFYISTDGLLHFQRLPYANSGGRSTADDTDADKQQKQKIFNILNSIFSINSTYQTSHPGIPVQMAWLCGLETELDEIATALKDAMGIEVGIAPAMPTGLPEESGYVPLEGYAAALQNNTATTYAPADFFRRFPLRKTSGLIIYAVTAATALLAITLTELEYRKLLKQSKSVSLKQSGKQAGPLQSSNLKNFDVLNKLTTKQLALYPLFRDLATELPDGIYLENFEFHQKDDKNRVELTAITRLTDKIPENMLLSRFVGMLDRSALLKNHQEPVVTVITKDKVPFLKIVVNCEVGKSDQKK